MYVRRDRNCQVASPQPNHETRQDVYGNSFENWCVDYIRTDVNNFPTGYTVGAVAPVNITSLDPVYFDEPIYASVKKDGVDYYYELIAVNGVPASQKSWAQEEEARGYVNMPWVTDGTSALLAEKYPEYAFLANPSYYEDANDLPPEATWAKPGDVPPITDKGGLLYYQTDDELHYIVGLPPNPEQKLVLYIGVAASAPPASASGCANQDPDLLLPKYIFNTVDNGVRTPSLYIDSPLVPGTLIEDAVTLEGMAILGLEEDRDLVLYNESNTQSLQLEDDTTVIPGTTFS